MIQYDFPSSFRRLELFFLDETSISLISKPTALADACRHSLANVGNLLCAHLCFIYFLPHSVFWFFCAKASFTPFWLHDGFPSLHKSLNYTSPTVATPSLPLLPALLPPEAAAGLAWPFPLQLPLSLALLPIAILPAPHPVPGTVFRKSAATSSYNLYPPSKFHYEKVGHIPCTRHVLYTKMCLVPEGIAITFCIQSVFDSLPRLWSCFCRAFSSMFSEAYLGIPDPGLTKL